MNIKNFLPLLTLVSTFAFSAVTPLNLSPVELAQALIQPNIQSCVSKIYNIGHFSVSKVSKQKVKNTTNYIITGTLSVEGDVVVGNATLTVAAAQMGHGDTAWVRYSCKVTTK